MISQVIKRNPKKGSYRLGQTIPYKLTDSVKTEITSNRTLFRFLEDYFHVSRESVYRFIRTNDPALTQIGFLQELAGKLEGVGIHEYESLIERV